jgi:hypothetical protein
MDRELPTCIEAERALLGSCLLERDAILKVRGIINLSDFYLERHCWIYEAFLECVSSRTPPDITTVSNVLRKMDRLKDAGGITYLGEISAETPHGLHAEHYARIVAETAAQRRLIELGGKISGLSYTSRPEDVLRELREHLILEQRVNPNRWEGQAKDGGEIWHTKYPPTVFNIDKILPAGTYLLVGKSKTRKSWLALNFAYAIAAGGKALGHFTAERGDALYIDLEMGERRISRRLKTIFPTQPPPQGVSFVTSWPRVGEGFEEEFESYLESNPYTRLIIVDTLVHVRPPRRRSMEPYEQDKEFAQTLTDLCQDKDITLLLVHHARKMAGTDVVDDSSGTMGLTGGVDNVASLSRTDEKEGGLLRFVGRDIELDEDLDLKWDSRLAQWNYAPQSQSISYERKLVLNLLSAQPGLMPRQVAERLGKPEHATRRLLSDMRKAGQLESSGGQYYLLEPETPPNA